MVYINYWYRPLDRPFLMIDYQLFVNLKILFSLSILQIIPIFMVELQINHFVNDSIIDK